MHVHQDQIEIPVTCLFQRHFTVHRKRRLQAGGAQQIKGDFLVDFVVLRNQHAAPAMAGIEQALGFIAGERDQCLLLGQVAPLQAGGEPELAAAARGADQTGFATHQPGQPTGDGQPETGATEPAGGRIVGLLEGFENACLFRLGDAGAGVGDGKAHQQFVAAGFHQPGSEHDAAALGEFDGIAQVIEQDLAET